MDKIDREKLVDRRTRSLGGREDMVLFLGTERGLEVLKGLIREKVGNILAVCVQDAGGHGAEAVEEIFALSRRVGVDTASSSSLEPGQYKEFLSRYSPSLALCVNWRRLFPGDSLYVPDRGLVVAHDSLLPHLRGFAPLNHAIRNGEKETGVTLFYAEEKVDSGDIIGQSGVAIGDDEFVKHVRDRVTKLTVDLVLDCLPKVLEGDVLGVPQDEEKATYGVRLTPEDGKVDFSKSVSDIFNLIRATSDPYPGAFVRFGKDGKICKIWKASVPSDSPKIAGGIPGRIIAFESGKGIFVCTGDNKVILLEEIETEEHGRKRADLVFKSHTTTFY